MREGRSYAWYYITITVTAKDNKHEDFPFPLIADGVWYPVGIFGTGFPFNYLSLHFPHWACRKKCSDELELEFRGPYQARGPPGEPRTFWDPSLLDYVSRRWETHPGMKAWVNNQTSHVMGGLAPTHYRRSSSRLPTFWPMTFIHIVTSTSRREEETGRLSLSLNREVTTVSLFHVCFL